MRKVALASILATIILFSAYWYVTRPTPATLAFRDAMKGATDVILIEGDRSLGWDYRLKNRPRTVDAHIKGEDAQQFVENFAFAEKSGIEYWNVTGNGDHRLVISRNGNKLGEFYLTGCSVESPKKLWEGSLPMSDTTCAEIRSMQKHPGNVFEEIGKK